MNYDAINVDTYMKKADKKPEYKTLKVTVTDPETKEVLKEIDMHGVIFFAGEVNLETIDKQEIPDIKIHMGLFGDQAVNEFVFSEMPRLVGNYLRDKYIKENGNGVVN